MDKVIEAFADKGILGLICIALGFTVVRLWGKNDEIQEKRIAESRESIKAIEQNTNTLDMMTEVLKERGK
jgi:hypothetical protein